jgi:Fe-S-cluster containining protein
MACKPGCGDCCGAVPWSAEEWAKVKDRVPAVVAVEIMDIGDGGVIPLRKGTTTCPFFSGGCTVYDDRPFMCRLYGTAPDARLTCPHGCRPKQMISAAKARALTNEYSGR